MALRSGFGLSLEHGPIGASMTVIRLRHLATAFGFAQQLRLSAAIEASIAVSQLAQRASSWRFRTVPGP